MEMPKIHPASGGGSGGENFTKPEAPRSHESWKLTQLNELKRDIEGTTGAFKEIPLDIWRKLFRILDEDCSGELDFSELQLGLVKLGFNECENPMTMQQFMSAIDSNHARGCTISEDEFLKYFSQFKSKAALSAGLKIKEELEIEALQISPGDGSQTILKTNDSKLKQSDQSVGGFLSTIIATKPNVWTWLDISGYDKTIITAVADAFDFDSAALTQMFVHQNSRIEVI